MNFIKTGNSDTINTLRSQWYQKLTAPIDAMWELLYIASSQHYLIDEDNTTIGYCCINEVQCLLQIFLTAENQIKMNEVITELIGADLITSASLSSNEPISFNTCLVRSTGLKTNTYCFQHVNAHREVESSLSLELVSPDDIPSIKNYLKTQVGMDDTFGYTENLVARKEIFMVKQSDVIIATSERRISDSPHETADLGIIVNKDFQGKGIATQVMKMQVNRVLDEGRKPICSTTFDNIASRKAIEKSGFYCSNVIFDIRLTDKQHI